MDKKKPTESIPLAERADITPLHLEMLLDAYDLVREKSSQVAGASGGRTKRGQRIRIEEFMADQLARGTKREVILDRAESRFPALARDTLERYYLRPVLKRVRPMPQR